MVKFLFCGDFVSQAPNSIVVDEKLKDLFKERDFVAVNFEAPIRGCGSPIHKSGPSLTQSTESPAFLETLGVNIIQLANNHIMDQDKAACVETCSCFHNSLLLGAGSFDKAYQLSVIEKDNTKIGLLCLVQKEFGALGLDSKSDDYGTAWINHPLVNKIILGAKKKCDVLIVLPHAGVEDLIVPLLEWRARYKEFIDLGADAVIASHPHTPQGWEEYDGKMIFYSLGNFFFQSFSKHHTVNWYKGLVVELNVDSSRKITFNVINTKFTDNQLLIDDSAEQKEYNCYLCELLSDEEKYNKLIDYELKALWPEYKLYLLRGLAAFNLTLNAHTLFHSAYGLFKGADLPMMLNNFQCESHRWAIERMLKLKMN